MKLKTVALGVLAVVALTLMATVTYAWHQGYRAYVVRTGSMVPTFDPGDAVLDRRFSPDYSIGDAITFELGPDVLVTHRLRRIDTHGLLHTKGDANRSSDAWKIPPQNVRGVVDHVLPNVGYVMVFLRQKTGVAGVMTSALAIVLLWGLCFPGNETAPPTPPAEPRIPRQRRGPVVRIPRQRGGTDPVPARPAPTSSGLERRMPPTSPPGQPPYRRLPPTPAPVVTGRPIVTRVPRPRPA